MIKSSKNLFALSALLLASSAQAKLIIDNNKPEIGYQDLKLPETSILGTIATFALPTAGCAVVGLIGGAMFDKPLPGLCCGAAAGFCVGLREQLDYNAVAAKSEGLGLIGAAAQNNEEGVKALIAYHKGWYLFKGQIGNPELTDSMGKNTALHYAAAVNAHGVAELLVSAVGTKYFKIYKDRAREVGKQGPTTTLAGSTSTGTAVAAGVAALIGGPAAASAVAAQSRRNSSGMSHTFGSSTEKVAQDVDERLYVNLQNAAQQTAANVAARTGAIKTFKFLKECGGTYEDKYGPDATVNALAEKNPALKEALNQDQGK